MDGRQPWWAQWWLDHAIHGPGFVIYMVVLGLVMAAALAAIIIGLWANCAPDSEGAPRVNARKSPVKVIEAVERQPALHWCQGCDRIIETIWMTWEYGTYRCLTCVDRTGVPAFPDDYARGDRDPATWDLRSQDRRRMKSIATQYISREATG